MTPTFRKEWRLIDLGRPLATARHYDNPAEAHADAERYPGWIVQHRLVSDWKAHQWPRTERNTDD